VGFDPYKNEANVLYVHGLFWFFQALLEKNAPAAAQKNINLEILRGLEVPKPPVDLQNQFAGIVEKIEDIKTRYEQSLTELEDFYGSLSQNAFKGELDLSRVPLVKVANDQLAIELDEKKLPVEPDAIDAHIATLDRAAMATTDGRKRVLQQSFTTWLQNPANQGTSSMAEFWRTARINALDYSDEETGSPEFSLIDYDALKQWVFDEIAQARISQTLNTKIVPGEAINSGSEIVLRKAK
jgi:type I restriction enzyme S subunit